MRSLVRAERDDGVVGEEAGDMGKYYTARSLPNVKRAQPAC